VAPESGELEKEPGDGEDGAEEALIQPLQQPPRRDAAKVRERRRRRVAMTGCGSEDELWGGGANKGRSAGTYGGGPGVDAAPATRWMSFRVGEQIKVAVASVEEVL